MSIFLGKQFLGQRDVSTTEHTGAEGGPIELDASELNQDERDELRKLITRSSRPSTNAEGS